MSNGILLDLRLMLALENTFGQADIWAPKPEKMGALYHTSPRYNLLNLRDQPKCPCYSQ